MRRLWKILIIVVPLLVIAVAAAVALRGERISALLVPVVESQLSRALEREVRIERISGGLLRGAVIHDLRIAEGKTLEQGALVRVKRVAVTYRARDLLWGPGPAAAIDRVEVSGADARLTRDRAGRWNIAPLLKPRPPTAPRFTGTIDIADSSVTFTDELAPAPLRRPLRVRMVNVRGRVLNPRAGVVFHAAASAPDSGVKRIAASGSSADGRLRLRVEANDLDLARWGPALNLRGAAVVGGSADISFTGATVRRGGQRRLDYLAQARVRGGAARLGPRGQVVQSVDGQALIARDQVRLLDVTGRLGPGGFQASGTVSDFSQPRLNLSLAADNVPARAAAALINADLPRGLEAGPLSVRLEVTGTVARPIARGDVRAARAQFALASPRAGQNALAVREVTAQVVYHDGMVWLRDARLATEAGAVTGDVWLRVAPGPAAAAFEARAQGVDLGRLVAIAPGRDAPRLSGTVDADVAGAYDAHGLRLAGAFEAREGEIAEVPFTLARGAARIEGGAVHITGARLESAAGIIAARGSVEADGGLVLEAEASQVDLATWGRVAGIERDLQGTGYFAGAVSGTVEQPQAAAVFEVLDARIQDQRFDLVSGSLTVSREQLSVQDVVAYQEQGRYSISGSLAGLDRPPQEMAISGSVGVDYARLGPLLAALGIEAQVDGDVEATAQVTGTVGAPAAQGFVRVHQASYQGVGVETAEARFEYEDGVTTLTQGRVAAGDSELRASGEVANDGRVDLTFAGDVELAELQLREVMRLPLDLVGRVTAAGDLTGTLKEPVITIAAHSERVEVDGQAFTDVAVSARPGAGQAQRVEVEVGFNQEQARYSAAGWADVSERTMEVELAVAAGQLGSLRRAVQALTARFGEDTAPRRVGEAVAALPAPVRGRFDVRAVVRGEWSKPRADVNLSVQDAAVAGTPVPDATADVAIGGRVLRVNSFEARQGPAYAVARGVIDLDGPVELDADVFNLNAQVLEPWLDIQEQVTGSADISLAVTGTVEQPQVIGSLEIADLSAGGVAVDALRVSRFEVRQDALVAEDVTAALGPHVVSARAELPVTWRPVGVDRSRPLLVRVDLSDQDLGLVQRLAPDLAAASGSLDGRVELTGTWDDFRLAGALTVAQGRLQGAVQEIRVTDLEGALRFEGREVILDGVTGRLGDDRFHASGRVELVSLQPAEVMSNRFDISVVGSDLGVRVAPLFEGKVNVRLALVSEAGRPGPPVLRGMVVAPVGDVGLPERGTMRAPERTPVFNPRLDIALTVEPNVWVRTPTIAMQVSGRGHVGGRLGAPVVTATFESRRGTVELPAAHFRVNYASLEASVLPPVQAVGATAPTAQVRAFIRLDAEANVRGYRVFLFLTGPLTDPQVDPTLELTSVPALEQDRLWAMVTGLPVGPGAPGWQAAAGGLITRGLGAAVLSPIERAVAAALGVAEFGVEYTEHQPLRIRVGGYVIERVYGTFIRSVAGPEEWDLVLAYEVRPYLSLGVRVDERNLLYWEAYSARRF